jgi:hypothetical protein
MQITLEDYSIIKAENCDGWYITHLPTGLRVSVTSKHPELLKEALIYLQNKYDELKVNERSFNRLTDCIKCKRYIDEKEVKLKRIVMSGDTYRHKDALLNPAIKYEKLCVDCYYKR